MFYNRSGGQLPPCSVRHMFFEKQVTLDVNLFLVKPDASSEDPSHITAKFNWTTFCNFSLSLLAILFCSVALNRKCNFASSSWHKKGVHANNKWLCQRNDAQSILKTIPFLNVSFELQKRLCMLRRNWKLHTWFGHLTALWVANTINVACGQNVFIEMQTLVEFLWRQLCVGCLVGFRQSGAIYICIYIYTYVWLGRAEFESEN